MKSIFNKSAKNRTKNVIVSIVALVLSVCMLTSVTYSWIDKISEISVVSPKPDGKTTLTIDSTTNSVINLQADNTETVIDLGSYFNMGGNMHLTSCSSNGKDFFFKSGGDENNSYFRRGSANDVNVNYISCTFKVESSIDDTVLWFNELPQLTMGETSLDDYLRCAVTVDDETTVFAKGGSYNCVNSTTVSGTAGYTECTAVGAGNYLFDVCENYLFFIDKGDSKIVNVKLWIEDPESTLDINSKELKLNLSFLTTLNRRTVTFKDSTFSEDGINQVSSGNYYACLGSSLTKGEYDLDTYWGFAPVEGESNKYTVDIPIIYCNKPLLIMNCDDSYGSGDNQLNDETINYNYIWVAGTMGDQDTYNAFGALGDVKKSQNGFWGTTKKVFVDDQMGLDVSDTTMLMYENDNDKQNRSMYYNVVKGKWVGYIHSDSTQIRFQVSGTQNYWGYHSNTNNEIKGNSSDTYTIYDIKNGTWATNKYLSSYSIMQYNTDSWNPTPMLYRDSNTSYASVDIPESGTYDFKILSSNSGKWYSSPNSNNSFDTCWNRSGDITLNGDTYQMQNGWWDDWTVSGSGSNDNKKLYFKPSSNWKEDGARFAAYFFNDENNKWRSLDDPDGDGTYITTVPNDMTKVIFARFENTYVLDFGTGEKSTQQLSVVEADDSQSTSIHIDVNAPNGGTLLFVYNNSIHKLDIQYVPSVAKDNNVRSYFAINDTYWDDSWDKISKIKHNGTDKESDLMYVGDGTKTVKNNCYTIPSNASTNKDTKALGSWSYEYVNKIDDNKIYLKPQSNWLSGNAKFVAYFFGSGDTWKAMTHEGNNIYSVSIPDSKYTSVIFCRMDQNSALNWNNVWTQTDDVSLNRGTNNLVYDLYYADINKNATYMQWVSNNNYCRPGTENSVTSGYNMGTPENGALYYLSWDSASKGCGKCTTSIQNPPTISASTTGTVGTSITFNISAESTTGVAGKGKSYSYYVTNTATDTTWVTDSTWTPLFEGTYEVTARANDGYITTDVSNTVTIKVTND